MIGSMEWVPGLGLSVVKDKKRILAHALRHQGAPRTVEHH